MTSPDATLRVSKDQSFEMVRNNAHEDSLSSFWKAVLHVQSELRYGKVAAPAIDESPINTKAVTSETAAQTRKT